MAVCKIPHRQRRCKNVRPGNHGGNMLVAEIYRKGFEEARNHEDYLTSAVFGHLRYLPPGIFWEDLFKLAKGMPSVDGAEANLAEAAAAVAAPVCRYRQLRVHFWRNHPEWGEPDLL